MSSLTSAAASSRGALLTTRTWYGRWSSAARIAWWSPSAASLPLTTSRTLSASDSTSSRMCEETRIVRPSRGEPVQELLELDAVARVGAVQRLVEDQQLGLVDERRGELDPLLHPARVGADAPVGGVGQVDVSPSRARGSRHVANVAQSADSSTSCRPVRISYVDSCSDITPIRR